MKRTIILSDLQTRKAFDIYGICTSFDYNIIGTTEGSSFERSILSLIYTRTLQPLNSKKFSDDFEHILDSSETKPVFFPTEEKTILNFYKYMEDNSAEKVFYNLPSKSVFNLVRDKGAFSEFCLTNKLPVPKEYDYKELTAQDSLPCNLIIKPKIGSGSMGIRFIDRMDELRESDDLDFTDYLIQERLENSTNVEGAFFLFDKGKMVSYYGHKRIRTYPEEGGVTVYSKCEVNDTLMNLGSDLLTKLNWSGLAMVEFLYDEKSKTYKIIEVNPRAWGSIMLSEFCGSHMIENYIRTSMGEKPIAADINEDTYIRWVFPWDVISYIKKKGHIENFWDFGTTKTCYINFTYASWYRSTLFLIYNVFDPNKISKLFKKIFK